MHKSVPMWYFSNLLKNCYLFQEENIKIVKAALKYSKKHLSLPPPSPSFSVFSVIAFFKWCQNSVPCKVCRRTSTSKSTEVEDALPQSSGDCSKHSRALYVCAFSSPFRRTAQNAAMYQAKWARRGVAFFLYITSLWPALMLLHVVLYYTCHPSALRPTQVCSSTFFFLKIMIKIKFCQSGSYLLHTRPLNLIRIWNGSLLFKLQ